MTDVKENSAGASRGAEQDSQDAVPELRTPGGVMRYRFDLGEHHRHLVLNLLCDEGALPDAERTRSADAKIEILIQRPLGPGDDYPAEGSGVL